MLYFKPGRALAFRLNAPPCEQFCDLSSINRDESHFHSDMPVTGKKKEEAP